jgi:hypothetical protein
MRVTDFGSRQPAIVAMDSKVKKESYKSRMVASLSLLLAIVARGYIVSCAH